MKFNSLNIHDSLKEAIAYMGFEELTPIQEQAIPAILDGKDLIACAQTGTGKTVAFVLPVLNKLIDKNNHETDTLIIVPTRELAIQIEQQIQGLSYFVSVSSMATTKRSACKWCRYYCGHTRKITGSSANGICKFQQG